MSQINVKLLPNSLVNVPFHEFTKDFTFIVNGKEFETSRVVASILSPNICQNKFNDPSIMNYTINTKNTGDFQHVLKLINFESNSISEAELPFITEIIEKLGNRSIEISDVYSSEEMTLDYVFNQIKKHENFENFYSKSIEKEISFISSHFYEMEENHYEILETLKKETIEQIICNENLRLESEDQLITFINKLYSKNSIYSNLYEYVNFLNVTASKISEFLMNYDTFDLTQGLWNSLSLRLQQPIIKSDKENGRYFIQFLYDENKEFDGIINHLQKKYKKEIFNHINVSSSGIYDTDQKNFSPSRSILYDNEEFFKSKNVENSWLCFDFKNYRVVPLSYSIRSPNMGENGGFLKNWVIEGCKNIEKEENWKIIDEQKNCEFLIGRRFTHTFSIQDSSKEEFRFLRLRQTGPSYNGNNILNIESIEFYGRLLS